MDEPQQKCGPFDHLKPFTITLDDDDKEDWERAADVAVRKFTWRRDWLADQKFLHAIGHYNGGRWQYGKLRALGLNVRDGEQDE